MSREPECDVQKLEACEIKKNYMKKNKTCHSQSCWDGIWGISKTTESCFSASTWDVDQ